MRRGRPCGREGRLPRLAACQVPPARGTEKKNIEPHVDTRESVMTREKENNRAIGMLMVVIV